MKAGDVVEVSVSGLGTLRNEVASPSAENLTVKRVAKESVVPISNMNKSCGGQGLLSLNGKSLYYRHAGDSGSPILFIHGLGGSSEFYTPLISALNLQDSHSLHLLDLEGHGLSPTSATSVISIESYAEDFAALASHLGLQGVTVIAHSMGCLVAETLTLRHPELINKLVLLGPPPAPLPEAAQTGSIARAATVRGKGMAAVVDAVLTAGTSAATKSTNPLAVAAVRMSLLGQDPEGYAKGCTALAGATKTMKFEGIKAKTLIITGDEDKVSPPALCQKMTEQIPGSETVTLKNCGHWHIFEDVAGVASALKDFL